MKKGFTLVELLAVIVILALILAIAVPTITSLIATSKKNMFENSSKMILKSMKNDYDGKIASNGSFVDTFIIYDNGVRTVYPSSNNLDFTISATDGGIVRHSDGTVTFALYDGTNCSVKTRTSNDITVTVTDKANCISNVIYKQASAPFTNLVANGDFSNGTTGWTTKNASLSYGANVLQIIGNGALNRIHVTFSRGEMIANNKYYFNFNFKSRNPYLTTVVYYVGSVYGTYDVISNPIQDKLYNYNNVLTCQSNSYALFYIYYPDAATATNQLAELSNVFLIDLTATYNSGNEPTQAQMDNNVNKVWIDTTNANTPKRFTGGGWINY